MKNLTRILVLFSILFIGAMTVSCESKSAKKGPTSTSGVTKATAKIAVGSDGLSVEQRNIKKRLDMDNAIGAIKHLYVISAMSGEVILYSTVDGKVTSGGKRLTSTSERWRNQYGNVVMPKIQDDGTYGSSMNYLYWWDVKGVGHQHYVTGGQIVHISEEALPVSDITINLSSD
ncbi:MAG: hypothetical protein KUG81_08645 [Gammaproteobacteria bacterium]|nr:hypothetical protein [Gammaproteobacteria bacterium]